MNTKKTILSLVVLSVALFLPAIAQADWDPKEPAKWVQMPDLTPNGMDVDITIRDLQDGQDFSYIRVLADDFQCTQTGPITDIHIWGSWKDDILPPDILIDSLPGTITTDIPGSENVMFFLGILRDIPAVTDPADPNIVLEHSRPGELLWGTYFYPGQYTSRLYHTLPRDATGAPNGEGWYDAHDDIYTPNADENIWQYNFLIDEVQAFKQEGTSDEPITYWLSVLASVEPGPDISIPGVVNDVIGETGPLFGWKTSPDQWNDDATYANVVQDDNGPITGPDGLQYGFSDWSELVYPDQHEFAGRSADLAFVITPEPATLLVMALGLMPALLKRRKV